MPALPESAVSSSPRISRRLHAVEFARGAACGAVLLFHSLTALPPDSLHPILRGMRALTQYGWLGVNVFFAVSGWCIAERLASSRRRTEPVGAFLRERALRIYPTYWIALAVLLVVRLAASPFNNTRFADNFPHGALAWFGDLSLTQPYVGTSPALVVSWSLVYELGFYVLGAGALILRRRGISSFILLSMGLLLMLPPLFGWQSRVTYILGLWPDFFAGVLAWRTSRVVLDGAAYLGAAGLLVLLILTVSLGESFGGIGRIVAVGTAAVLLLASRYPAAFPGPGSWRGLAGLGGISYSLYLIHVTVLSPVTNLGGRFVHADRFAFVIVWLSALALALTAGWAFHRWVEAPIESWRKTHWGTSLAPRPQSL